MPEFYPNKVTNLALQAAVENPAQWTDAQVLNIAMQAAVVTSVVDFAGVLNLAVQVAVRADHRPGGGRVSSEAMEGTEENGDMIYHDIIFPECIVYGSTGVPRYVTDKIEAESGSEQRNSRRQYPIHEYKILMENVPAPEIAEIMNIWHVCSGDHIGFLFLDPMDHTSSNDVVLSGSEVSPDDQFVSIAVAGQTSYELFKFYKVGEREKRRRVKFPMLDTLRVSVDGEEVFNWQYSYDTQLLTFVTVFNFTGMLSHVGNVISGGNFSALNTNDLVYIDGWAWGANNITEGESPARVVSATATELVLELYNGAVWGSGRTAGPSNVTIKSVAPPVGSEIRAGFYFYTPVRFGDGEDMVSEITGGLRESAFATFDSITLREIMD